VSEATYLQDSGVKIEGLNFWGSLVNSVDEGWVFSRERLVKIRKHWDCIPDDTDVLITHEPPYGTLDKNDLFGKHHGCQYLTGALLRIKPGSTSSGTFMGDTVTNWHGTARLWSTAPS